MGSVQNLDVNKIQITQNTIFCLITKSFFYVSNQTLPIYLKINTVTETVINSYSRYHSSFFDHLNIIAKTEPN